MVTQSSWSHAEGVGHTFRGDYHDFPSYIERWLNEFTRWSSNDDDLESKVELGKRLVAGLGEAFLKRNYGWYVAVSLDSGRVVARSKSLENLNRLLIRKGVEEELYVERVGYGAIASML